MRALQRLRVPTLLFVNKIDRSGANADRTLTAIEERLTPAVVPMGSAAGLGTRTAAYLPFGEADPELVERSRAGELHPVFFGSALTGAGVEELRHGTAELLPATAGDAGPLSARVFKIERGPGGDRIAYVRMFSGTLRVRERVEAGKVTGIRVFEAGDAVQRDSVRAGEIARVWGLAGIRIGDWIGKPLPGVEHRFAPPTLEAVVVPADAADGNRLRVALEQLAEQDPLIDVRQDDERHEISVSLYGEVQKDVIEATLAADYGLDVRFRETTTICVERPAGTGEAVEILNTPTNPFHADLGLRVEPLPPGSGVAVRVDVDPRDAPLYVYKSFEGFVERIQEYVLAALEEGLFGWQVTDCTVTVTRIGYSLADGPPSRRGPMPTPGDLKKLTPVVLMQALRRAGVVVCEPVVRIGVEVPAGTIGAVLAALGRLGAPAATPSSQGELARLATTLPAARVPDLQRQLPALTGGEGVLEADFAGYEPVAGEPPTRRRTTPDPLNLEEYVYAVGRT